MRGYAGPWLTDRMYTTILAQPAWAGLHNAAVNASNPVATEISATRQRITWSNVGAGALANVNLLVWGGLPAASLQSIAVYTAATSGALILWCPIVPPVSVGAGGQYQVAAHELYLDIY